MTEFKFADWTGTINGLGKKSKAIKYLIIPAEIDGVPVRAINSQAFADNPRLVSVTIPDSVEVVGCCAFANCTALERVMLGRGVREIESGAFRCTALERVTIPDSVEVVGNWAFEGCAELESVEALGDTRFGWHCFYNCRALRMPWLKVSGEWMSRADLYNKEIA